MTVDVRVIAATNQDLDVAIREKRFREDLFYRLNVIPIEVPPLRERREDMPLLVAHFLERMNAEEEQARPRHLATDALELLVRHDWPGNVRELENLIERIVVLRGEGEIDARRPAARRCGGDAGALASAADARAPAGRRHRLPRRGRPLRDRPDPAGARADALEQEAAPRACSG